ncbi:MAG: transposase [Ignavibacteriales bacterium]|nr:transposase [Ignavibacteriales bacterium]
MFTKNSSYLSRLHQEISPFYPDVVVGVESTFNYYWLQDACQNDDVQFCLGHALYMRVGVHKKKDDKLDSYHIAQLMRNGTFPFAYAFPPQLRGLRELLRERLKAARHRGSLYTRFYIKLLQHFGWSPAIALNPAHNSSLREEYIRSATDPALKLVFQQLRRKLFMESSIDKLEKTSLEITRLYMSPQLNLVTSIPGIGFVLE